MAPCSRGRREKGNWIRSGMIMNWYLETPHWAAQAWKLGIHSAPRAQMVWDCLRHILPPRRPAFNPRTLPLPLPPTGHSCLQAVPLLPPTTTPAACCTLPPDPSLIRLFPLAPRSPLPTLPRRLTSPKHRRICSRRALRPTYQALHLARAAETISGHVRWSCFSSLGIKAGWTRWRVRAGMRRTGRRVRRMAVWACRSRGIGRWCRLRGKGKGKGR